MKKNKENASRELQKHSRRGLWILLLLIPAFIPICKISYRKWFKIYGGYTATILGIFAATYTLMLEIDKNTIKENRKVRMEIYKDLTIVSGNIISNLKELRKLRFSANDYKDPIKALSNYNKMFGVLTRVYNLEQPTEESLIAKRYEIITKIIEVKTILLENIDKLLENKIMFIPIDDTEKKDMNYENIDKYIAGLNIFRINLDHFIRSINNQSLESEKDILVFYEKYEKREENTHNITDPMECIDLYLKYMVHYLQCDIIYIDTGWKDILVDEYTERLTMIETRDDIFKEFMEKQYSSKNITENK